MHGYGYGPIRLRRTQAAGVVAALLGILLLFVGVGPVQAATTVNRIEGDDRYATAVKISQRHYPSSARVVYLADGRNFPDALAGAPVAANDNAPLLLARGDTLPADTTDRLTRLKPQTVRVLGGPAAVPHTAVNAVKNLLPGVTVDRIAGDNRYATAAQIAADHRTGASVVYVASGENYPDALAAGPLAGTKDAPVLLVRSDAVPDAVRAQLTRLAPKNIVVLGGPSAVTDEVVDHLREFTTGNVTRLQGSDRYGTSVAISKDAFTTADSVYLATGENFPDALAGGPAAIKDDAPILLVRKGSLPKVVQAELTRLDPSRIIILGGTSAVSQKVVDAVRGAGDDISARAAAALRALDGLTVTSTEAPGYDRSKFGSGWAQVQGCDTRNRVLIRDLTEHTMDDGKCHVLTGTLKDPYTGKSINFVRGVGTSNAVQIDHVVAVSTAWKMGANTWNNQERRTFYNDTDNLLAVDGPTNGSKGDKTLGEWQPPNKDFHCEFTYIYIETSDKYDLAVKPVDVSFAEDLLPTC